MTDKTYAQKARQRRRTHAGRYEKMNECDLCGKALGEDYFSDIRVDSDVEMPDGSIVNFGYYGLCLCARCCKKLDKMSNLDAYEALTGEKYELHFDPRAPGDYESGDADRITPDAAGDAVTADEPTARPVDTLRVAWNAAHIMARLRGYQSDAYRRMQGVFDSMRAYSRLTPQSA